MKTPIRYYGGKQNMLAHILPLIPPHELYTECFCGGAAVFWAKSPSKTEVINDINGEVVNFYEIAKTETNKLARLINATLHSEKQHSFAKIVYNYPEFFPKLRRAWAFFVLCSLSFSGDLGAGYLYGNNQDNVQSGGIKRRFLHKMANICKRLERVQIEQTDAVNCLTRHNAEFAFHYVDPPYIDVNQGHYAGYTEADYELLLQRLATLKGKFMLSCYDSEILQRYAKEHGWIVNRYEKPLCAVISKDGAKKRNKTELLVMNYEIKDLFS